MLNPEHGARQVCPRLSLSPLCPCVWVEDVPSVPGAPSTTSSSGASHPSLYIFPQSLKSDEEAKSAKEPQNELLEAQGNAVPILGAFCLWPELGELGCQAVHSHSCNSWEMCTVAGFPGGPLLQGWADMAITPARWSHCPHLPWGQILGQGLLALGAYGSTTFYGL